MDEYIIVGGELYHYGVKGMRWGHRRAQRELPTSDVRRRFDSAKAEYKQANKAYSKSFDKAYNRNIGSFSPIKKHRDASTKRWEDAVDKAKVANKAKANYKAAKKARKTQLNSSYKQVSKNSSVVEKLTFNNATRKKAAKYMVDNNMSMSDAKRKANSDAVRNTAAVLAVVGGVAVTQYLRQ